MVLANSNFVWRRFKRQKTISDRWLVLSMRLADFSRSFFLFLAATENIWTILVIYDSFPWRVPCQAFRIPTIILVAIMFFQILFIFSRLVVVYSCLPKYSVSDALKVLLPFLLIWCILTVISQVWVSTYSLNGICYFKMDDIAQYAAGVFFIVIELVSFWLFYKPLREVALPGQYSQLKIVATEQTVSRMEYYGMRPSTTSLLSDDSQSRDDEVTNRVIRQFSASIKRNFYCWVVTLIVTISWFSTFFLCMHKMWYWTSGFGEMQITFSLTLIYVSMVACEKHWLRMFILW